MLGVDVKGVAPFTAGRRAGVDAAVQALVSAPGAEGSCATPFDLQVEEKASMSRSSSSLLSGVTKHRDGMAAGVMLDLTLMRV